MSKTKSDGPLVDVAAASGVSVALPTITEEHNPKTDLPVEIRIDVAKDQRAGTVVQDSGGNLRVEIPAGQRGVFRVGSKLVQMPGSHVDSPSATELAWELVAIEPLPASTPRSVQEDLIAMDGQSYRGARGVLYVETRNDRLFLSGTPYLWSGFAERAYELGEDDARDLIARHPKELAGAVFRRRD